MKHPSKLLTIALLATTLSLAVGVPSFSDSPPASPSASPTLVAGDTEPTFYAEGIDGVVKHITYPKGSSTVLLFFLSSCPACHKMIPEWNLAFGRKPAGLQVVGVLLDHETPGFFMATPISFPVVRSPGGEFSKSFKISKVPMTLRIGPGGKVLSVDQGQIDPIHLGEIFRP